MGLQRAFISAWLLQSGWPDEFRIPQFWFTHIQAQLGESTLVASG